MDESRDPREQETGQAGATETTRTDSAASTNGQASGTAAPGASRKITSKRVVIPTAAKRAAKTSASPAPTPVTPSPVEPSEYSSNGESASVADAPLATSTPIPVEPPVVFVPTEPITPPAKAEPETFKPSSTTETPASTLASEPATHASASSTPPAPIIPARYPAKPSTAAPKAEPSQVVKPTGLQYTPNPAPYAPITQPAVRKRRGLETVLWGSAIVFLIAAVVAALYLLNLIPGFGAPQGNTTPTQIAVNPPTTQPQPSATTTLLPTSAPTALPPVPTSAPLLIPTPPIDGQQFSFVPVTPLTGWFSTGETSAHYGDDNLHAGTLQGQTLSSIVQFPLNNLPTNTKILYAAIELTGREQGRMGKDGTWQLDLVENSLATDWGSATPEQLAQAKSLGTIGAPIEASELGTGRLNRFILSETERQMLEQQFKNGSAVFRLRGPEGTEDNLFTWESGASGSALSAPTLHLVFVPGQYVIVTNTPVAQNVLTAAAYVVRGTDQAKRNGTPTNFPPGVATGTPGGGIVTVAAETAIPGNPETAIARAQLATAIARTTGTFTPVPQTVIIIFPTNTPVVFTENLATATPIPPDTDLLTIPINYDECNCRGRILVVSERFGGRDPLPIMLDENGAELGMLSGDLYYRLALAREPYSPDRTKRLIYPPNSNGVQQIGYEDLNTGEVFYLTDFPKGIAYDAAWSPDGNYVAFVGTERGNTDEIYVYDFGTGQATRITDATDLGQPWSKHPSWSPDSQEIAFWSSRSGNAQIWIMSRDGSNLRNISNNAFDERDPVWVK